MLRSTFWFRLDYRWYRVIALVWMVFIFYMSHQPTVPMPSIFPGQDKFMHFISYGLLGFFLGRALAPWRDGLSVRQILLVTLLCALYALSDEYHQSYVAGRDASIADWIADVLGGFCGAYLLRKTS